MNPGSRIGSFEIVGLLGVGGMGEVYRATDTSLKRQVAIKVLPAAVAADAERVARFQREAEVLAALNHPNIAHIHGLEKSDGTLALVMELVEGPTLAEKIDAAGANGRGLPIEEALAIARQVAEALEAAHERGIIHRDLKPANIKVRQDGTVKVLDFGLAKAMGIGAGAGTAVDAGSANLTQSPTLSIHATQAGMILGTAAYMSPEQASGKPVDKRSDLWAFGVVLLEMLTGRRVFDGETVSHVLAAVLTREPDWTSLPAGTPRPVRTLLRRCLEKDRRKRLESAADARLEIDDALTAPAPEPSRAMPVRAGPPLVAAVALGAAIVAGFAMWVLTRPAPESRPLTRLTVDLGADAVDRDRNSVAISPDGRRIVFTISGTGGAPQLATRLLDQAVAMPLPVLENANDPFFPPDGEWVVFAADSKLKKIAVLGGAAFTICDAPNFRGGSWGPDGTIVAALSNVTGLSRVSSAGGAPQLLTKLAGGEVTHRWPQHMPDGQSVLFTASNDINRYDDATLQAVAVGTEQVTAVASGGYFGRYMAGHLVYIHQGVLFGAPFDVSRMQWGRSAPVPVLDDIASDPATGAGRFSASQTGTFVYRSGKAVASEYPIVWLGSTGKAEQLLKPGIYYTPRLSPDGQRLALALDAGKGNDIYVYDLQLGVLSRLTFNGHGNTTPVWAPDGKHLAYRSSDDKTIWWARADGAGEAQPLLVSKSLASPGTFSSDGRWLLYDEAAPGTGADIWRLPVDASDPEHPKAGTPEVALRTPANEVLPALSPDERWISYTSDESGNNQVYVRPNSRERSGKWQVSTRVGNHPLWSRDGRTLYYQAGRILMTEEYAANAESFTPRAPREWSGERVRQTGVGAAFDLARDGRFIILPSDTASDEQDSVRATFLLNFFDELHRRLP